MNRTRHARPSRSQTYGLAEATRIRDERERRYGTVDFTYVVERVSHGRWKVQRRSRPVGLRRLFERERSQ